MPQQFVRQENSTPDFSQLAQNLAQNVAYRRQKQDAKAQQRAQLQLAMDNGLIPGAEMEVGDNGIAFPSDAAQAAYQDALSTWGKEDLSRKGGVNTTTELVNDPMGQTAVLSAQARQGNTNPAVQKINQDILNTDVQSMRQNIRQSVDEQLKNVTSQNAASQQNSADITSTMANYLAQNIAPQLSGKGPLLPSAQGQTTPTDPQAQPLVPQPNSRIGAQTKVENKVQQMGVIEEHARQKGAKIDVKPMFQTTTEHQENFTDSIKRSLPSMAGLAMLESVNNMFGGPSNPVKQSAFQQLYEQRAADYKRFDEAMSKNGRSVGLSGGEVSVDEGESDSSLKNTDREYVSSKNDVNVKSGNIGGGSGDNPDQFYTFGNTTMSLGTDFEFEPLPKGGRTRIITTDVGPDNVNDRFTVRTADGKTKLKTQEIIDSIKQIVQSVDNLPEREKNMLIEEGGGTTQAFYSPRTRKYYADRSMKRVIQEPTNSTYYKAWDADGNQILYADANNLNATRLSEIVLRNIAKNSTGASRPGSGAIQRFDHGAQR